MLSRSAQLSSATHSSFTGKKERLEQANDFVVGDAIIDQRVEQHDKHVHLGCDHILFNPYLLNTGGDQS